MCLTLDDRCAATRLLWPRELFRDELAAVVTRLADTDQRPALELLLDEALRGPDPLEDLQAVPNGTTSGWVDDPWDAARSTPEDPGEDCCRAFGRELLDQVDRLPVYARRRYYWEREFDAFAATLTGFAATLSGPETEISGREVDWAGLRKAWIELVTDLVDRGDLDRLAGDRCDDQENEQPERIAELLKEHVGLDRLEWPLDPNHPDLASEEFLLSYVKAFHDLAARPRARAWHDYDEHYWYRLFDAPAGQAVYRWKVNDLLTRYDVELQLAESGEDQGLLVRRVPDPRQELITAVAANVPDRNEDRVAHAIALFRRRGATAEDRRSACTALAHVLEDRTPLITRLLNKKDESDLFHIANAFAIRHQNAQQRPDYAEDYLDWIFWWYLATVELTNRLMSRQDTVTDG